MQNQTSVPCALDPLLLCSCCKILLFLAALDAPSSGVCSAVHSQDRLPCASLPISQGDCEVRGCCYNPRDKVKTCYYGNTGECEWPSSPLMQQLAGVPAFPDRGLVYQSCRWLRAVVLVVKETH